MIKMPRSSGSSRSSFSKTPRFPVYTPPKSLPPPPPTSYTSPQTSIVQHQAPGVWDSVKQGFGWGVGTSIARSIFTPTTPTYSPPPSNTPSPQATQSAPKCQEFQTSFDVCVKAAPHDIQTCQEQLDKLNKCLST